MIKKTAKRLWLGISSILTCLCLVFGIIALSPAVNATAAIDGSLGNSVTLNKIQATSGVTAEDTTNQYVSFDMGVKGGNVWIMTQFTGKNAPNYAMNAVVDGLATWDSANAETARHNAGVLLTNSSEYNAEYLLVFNTTNTASGNARAVLGSGKDAGLKNLIDGQEYVQIIGYENSGDNSIAKITYYLFEISGGTATLTKSIIPTAGNGGSYSFAPYGQYVVLYGNIESSALDNDPDGVTFEYAKPASTLTGMLKGVSDYYEYKDDIATALNIQEDISEDVSVPGNAPEPEPEEVMTLASDATLNKIQATNGITATGTTNQYVSFDMGVEGGNVWIMTQFTGKNAPNYAMNAKVGGSATWTADDTSYNGMRAGTLLTNSSEYNAEYLQVFNTTNTAKGQARANPGTNKDAGLKNFTDGQEYIQIIGYENSGDNSTAKITYYLFAVTDGVATLSKSIVPTAGNGGTYSFRTDGQYVVLYGNIQSTGLSNNPDSVTFQYTKPASTLTGMLKGVSDQYAYKDDIAATLGLSEEDVKEEVEIVEDTSLENTATLNKIQATNGITATGTTNQYVSFDMGVKGGNVWIMTQFTGKNAPNYAMNAAASGLSTWTAENKATAERNAAGVLLTNSSEYNAEYLLVFNTTNTASGKARAVLGSGKDAGLKNFVDGQEYIQIIGYENSGDNSKAKITYYLFTVNNGVATLSKSIVPTAGNGGTYSFSPYGQYVVLYGNIQSTGLSSNPSGVTFQYTEPAATVTEMLKGVSDQYAYKDDIVATLGLSEEDVKEEVEIIENDSLANDASLNKIQATNGITATGTTNQYVSFDMGVKGGNVWIMTQFTGKNAPNYAMNAIKSGLDAWNSTDATETRYNAGVLLTNSSEYNAEYLQVFNTTNTASGKAKANLGTGKDAGLKNLVDGQEYIQIIGYENSGDNSIAKITYYLFTVTDGVATLSKSLVEVAGGALSFAPYGQYVVLYGNIESTGLSSNPNGVTFSYETPKTTLDELITGLASDYIYKDDIMSALNIAITVTLKDMEDNTLKTFTNVGAVKLPNSTLADFVGWYNETDGKLYKPGDILPVERDMSFVELASGIALEDGAAVRLKNDTLGIGGLRFEAVISKTIFDLLGDNIVFTGALIPTDLLTGELTLETAHVGTTELVNKEEVDDTYHAYITLTAIKLENFEREYSARAFVTVTYADGTTATIASAYNESKNVRSVYSVATKAYNSGNYGEHPVLKYYLNNAVNVAFKIEEGVYDVTTSHNYDGLSADFNRGYSVSNFVVDNTTVTFDVMLANTTYTGDVSVKFWSNANTSEIKIIPFVNGTASVEFTCDDAVPDYLNSDGEFTYWAYSATCGDYYQINNTKYYQDANGNQLSYTDGGANEGNVLVATNADTMQVYADAGFNVMFINWGATAYRATAGDYTTHFDRSIVRTIMNYAWEHDIKCFIYSTNLHGLSKSETSLIVGEGNGDGVTTFDTQADLVAYVEKMLYGVKDHPAFYGVSFADEPSFKQFDAISEVYQAVQTVAPGAFCNINLHPMSYDYRAMVAYNQASYDKYSGKTGEATATEMEAAYKDYINSYYEKIGKYCGYIQYDSYPMLTVSSGEFLYPHIRNAQIVAEFCEETGMRFGHVYQTYKDVFTSSITGKRGVDADDIEWQLNFGMAMGVKDHSYYTYYPVLNSDELPDEDYTFVDRAGNPNATYYTVKDLQSDMAVTAKALAHFEYRGLKYYTQGNVDTNMQQMLNIVENDDVFDNKMSGVALSANGVVLTTELYDEEAGRYGYFVMNATNPLKTVATQTVTLSFSGYTNVQIYQDGNVSTHALTNGQINLTLAEAAGAFVIPY